MVEFYTPSWIFKAILKYLPHLECPGKFSLDPASPQGLTPAQVHYSEKGLEQPWFGTVWMNPPFKTCQLWVSRFMSHGKGVALLPVSKSLWFDKILMNPDAKVVHLPSNLLFDLPNGKQASIRTRCCLVFLNVGYDGPSFLSEKDLMPICP